MPIITLTSDFGLQSHYVASVKGRILQRLPNVQIIDISHQINPFHLQQAVYIFKNTYLYFPEGSAHFVLNDLFASPAFQSLYLHDRGQHLFCADNGFITLLLSGQAGQIYRLNDKLHKPNYMEVLDLWLDNISMIWESNSFNAALIDVNQIQIKNQAFPYLQNNILEVQVLYIDNYGNVILNIQKPYFEEIRAGRKFKILFMRDEEINKLHNSYHDVLPNEKVCFFNTAGFLEIAINRGNAAELFGFTVSNDNSLFYTKINIFFE